MNVKMKRMKWRTTFRRKIVKSASLQPVQKMTIRRKERVKDELVTTGGVNGDGEKKRK